MSAASGAVIMMPNLSTVLLHAVSRLSPINCFRLHFLHGRSRGTFVNLRALPCRSVHLWWDTSLIRTLQNIKPQVVVEAFLSVTLQISMPSELFACMADVLYPSQITGMPPDSEQEWAPSSTVSSKDPIAGVRRTVHTIHRFIHNCYSPFSTMSTTAAPLLHLKLHKFSHLQYRTICQVLRELEVVPIPSVKMSKMFSSQRIPLVLSTRSRKIRR